MIPDFSRPLEVGHGYGYQFDAVPRFLLPRLARGGTGRHSYRRIGGLWWVSEREFPHDIRPWRPFRETVPLDPNGDPSPMPADETFLANSHYLVFRRALTGAQDMPDGLHLSMRTVENDTRHDWREMQRVKNELAGPEWEAMELYPAESRLVDTSNQYHLWCMPFQIGVGFSQRLVIDADNPEARGASQRPLPPDTELTDQVVVRDLASRRQL